MEQGLSEPRPRDSWSRAQFEKLLGQSRGLPGMLGGPAVGGGVGRAVHSVSHGGDVENKVLRATRLSGDEGAPRAGVSQTEAASQPASLSGPGSQGAVPLPSGPH